MQGTRDKENVEGPMASKQTELTETATGSEILCKHTVPVIEGEPEVIEIGKAQ